MLYYVHYWGCYIELNILGPGNGETISRLEDIRFGIVDSSIVGITAP